VQSNSKPDDYDHLFFSVSAYPDDWGILAQGKQVPSSFFSDYSAAYGPTPPGSSPYGYQRANDTVMLTYDALDAILVASKISGKQNPTSEDIKNGLSQIHDSQSFQGITGAISFGSDGNPVNKTHLIIRVVGGGLNHLAAYAGCFLVGSGSCDNTPQILE